jgi:hypothetical protein
MAVSLTLAAYLAANFPNYNQEIPFGNNVHTLSNIRITSIQYELSGSVWIPVVAPLTTPQTPDFKFGFTVSGYKALLQ